MGVGKTGGLKELSRNSGAVDTLGTNSGLRSLKQAGSVALR